MTKVKFLKSNETPSASDFLSCVNASAALTAARRQKADVSANITEVYARAFFKKNPKIDYFKVFVVEYKSNGRRHVVAQVPGETTQNSRSVPEDKVTILVSMSFRRIAVKQFVVKKQQQIRARCYIHNSAKKPVATFDLATTKLPKGATLTVKGSTLVNNIIENTNITKKSSKNAKSSPKKSASKKTSKKSSKKTAKTSKRKS